MLNLAHQVPIVNWLMTAIEQTVNMRMQASDSKADHTAYSIPFCISIFSLLHIMPIKQANHRLCSAAAAGKIGVFLSKKLVFAEAHMREPD